MKLFILPIIIISLNLKAQFTDPYQIIRNPIDIKSTMDFIKDSSKYIGAGQEDAYLQALGTLYSFVGHYNMAEAIFKRRNSKQGYIPDYLSDLDLKEYQINQDTLNALYARYNVLLFNEAHHVSRHRAFLYSQLEILKDLGFNQLALEALNAKDTCIKIRTYPINDFPNIITGVYINDPVYGNLIRKAIELGFTLIPYDSISTNREEAQAHNILRAYDKSKGKLVVFGGYGHISQEYPMMGYFLKKGINEDLLSISQFTRHSVKPIFPTSNSINFFLEKDETKKYDFYFYCNPIKTNSNIPEWYKLMNYYIMPLSNVYDKTLKIPSIIQVFNINEEFGVPVYQYLNLKNDKISISVPCKGKYILKISDKDHSESLTFNAD